MDPLRVHHHTPEAQAAVPCHHECMRSPAHHTNKTYCKRGWWQRRRQWRPTAVASNGSGNSLSDSCGDGYVEGSAASDGSGDGKVGAARCRCGRTAHEQRGSGGSEDGINNRWQRDLLGIILAEKLVEDELGRGSNPAEPFSRKALMQQCTRCSDSPKVFLNGKSKTLPN